MTFTPGKRGTYPFYGRWCVLFEHHLRRRNLSATAFASRVVLRSQQSVHDYLVGKVRPPPDLMEVFADGLELKAQDRADFIDAAWEAWTPEPVWKRLREAEAKAAAAVARKPSEVEKEAARQRTTIAELLVVLRDIYALFYARDVPVHRIAEKRAELGTTVARMIERHERPPAETAAPASPSAASQNHENSLHNQ